MISEPEVVVIPEPPETTSLTPREAAITLARSGALLTGTQLRAILQLKKSTFFYHQARGHYDKLKVKLPIGVRKYSGVLISRLLDGDAVYLPTFGRKKF